ncbi:hypothetical protein PAPYR_12949 [Paratrimastix pyriformis]|uniref:Uncharacterized protein n=1 Tax=Paratrimastix pyriformis TaxID=342808 RepID=A0ABQ8U116_9EUKA|nr:hypothetical protein PAPYR_12949 [Paratrimastix pyriformis]
MILRYLPKLIRIIFFITWLEFWLNYKFSFPFSDYAWHLILDTSESFPVVPQSFLVVALTFSLVMLSYFVMILLMLSLSLFL